MRLLKAIRVPTLAVPDVSAATDQEEGTSRPRGVKAASVSHVSLPDTRSPIAIAPSPIPIEHVSRFTA